MATYINPHFNAFIKQYSFISVVEATNSANRSDEIISHLFLCIPGVVFLGMTLCAVPTIYFKKRKFEALLTKEEKTAYLARNILQFVGLGLFLLPVDLIGTSLYIYNKRKKRKEKEEIVSDFPML